MTDERSSAPAHPVRTDHALWVTVLIVNWNTRDLLGNCLRSLMATAEAEQLEVVVVDNASTDGSAEMVRQQFPGVAVIDNPTNDGFARANNIGFDASDSPYVLLLNSDTEVNSGTIAYCRDVLAERPKVGVVGCRIENPDGTGQNSVFRFPSLRGVASTTLMLAQALPKSQLANHDRYGFELPARETDVDVVMGSFLMVRRADVGDAILDERYFMYSEEADLCRRMRDAGKRVLFVPEVSVMHVKGGSSRNPAQKAWSDEAKKRAQLQFLKKWEGTPTAYAANLLMTVGILPRAAGWLVADRLDKLRGRSSGRSEKTRALPFHLHAIVKPSLLGQRFHGIDQAEKN